MGSVYRPIQTPKLQKEQQRPGYSYQEYAPCEQLTPYVACYWTLDFHADVESQLHRIIPDGCVDIIVNRLSPSSRKAAFVEGIMTQYELIHLSEVQSLFGIRFFLESAQTVLKFPVSAFAGQHVFLEELWGLEGEHFVEEILSANMATEIVGVVERQLKRVFAVDDSSVHPLLHASVQYLYAAKGNLSMLGLAEELGFSERHLRRVFHSELGVGPKEMIGIVRFQSMLREIYSGSYTNLTDLALKYGYYDQSHYIKNFKRYYGILPKQISKTD
ncbi:DUF6597 domain-containing transcriptional factor [Cohnella soli]|uniref:DUF6597 domain-containing transcriptional factor n=1 Tax=Cohnella soli TaxID=425005 RepID=A0ABW0I019_9BACL